MQKTYAPHRKLTPETTVKHTVCKALRNDGWFVPWLLQAGVGVYKGMADRVAIKDGRVVWLEFKRPKGGKLSEYQIAFQRDIQSHGGEYRVVRGLDDVADMLGQCMMLGVGSAMTLHRDI